MTGSPTIQYFTHHRIDKEKWDTCIEKAANGLIYAYSFYLDIMSPGWEALVMNDYEKVMPLTWKKKWGIGYLYQPFLAAQLGIFGDRINPATVEQFVRSIPSSFKLIEISLNVGNHFQKEVNPFFERKNYLLPLGKNYEELYTAYNENTKRNLKKSRSLGCTVIRNIEVEQVIQLALQQMETHGKESAKNADRFRALYKVLYNRKMSTTYGIKSAENNLLASCVFFFSHNRAYYILVGNHPDGKATGASPALIDAFIRDHCGKKDADEKGSLTLDFEGSDIPSLAQFYSGFGAITEFYPALKINRLPFYIKWLKK